MKIKLFTDLNLLQKGFPVEVLIPFIGVYNKEDEPGSVLHGRFEQFVKTGKTFLELAGIENCDACLLPVYYDVFAPEKNNQPEIQSFLKTAEDSGKPILIFAGHDVLEVNIPIKNAIIFNSAINYSQKASNVYSWPHFFEDYLQKYNNGNVTIRNKGVKPIIGFCGYAPPLNTKFGSRDYLVGFGKLVANYTGILQKKYPDKISHSYRARAIVGLRKSKKIEPNFKLKSNFAFGPQGQLNTGNTSETHTEFRSNFVRNIIDSDYTLCVRGIGNNSVRFFETLCCGRIPVFVNTDSSLPFEDFINWKELCVWVEEKDIDRIDEVVSEFHKNISVEDFKQLQTKLRNIWEEYLSPVGFFKHLGLFIHHHSVPK